MPEEKKYDLSFTEKELTTLVEMIKNEDVDLVQRVSNGQLRIETINKLIAVVKKEESNVEQNKGNNK